MTRKSHHAADGYRNNYTGSVSKSLGEFLRWQVHRVRRGLPPKPSLPTPSAAAELGFIAENAAAGADMLPAVTWIGHATALVQACGLNVLTDPIFSARASPVQFLGPMRAQPPGIALGDLPHIDVVVISHNHYDHLDLASVRSLASQPGGAPLFLVPLGVREWLDRLGIRRSAELDWGDMHNVTGPAGVVEFHLTPAQHWSGRALKDRNRTLWGGWAALGEGFHWYFAGDTGYSPDFVDIRGKFQPRQTAAAGGGFDVALIPVAACLPRWFMQSQHVDPAEAVQIHIDIGAKCSLGVHWGTFALADDPLDMPLHELDPARRAKGVAAEEFILLPVGATRRFARRAHQAPGRSTE